MGEQTDKWGVGNKLSWEDREEWLLGWGVIIRKTGDLTGDRALMAPGWRHFVGGKKLLGSLEQGGNLMNWNFGKNNLRGNIAQGH